MQARYSRGWCYGYCGGVQLEQNIVAQYIVFLDDEVEFALCMLAALLNAMQPFFLRWCTVKAGYMTCCVYNALKTCPPSHDDVGAVRCK